jgi:hypothetical protein
MYEDIARIKRFLQELAYWCQETIARLSYGFGRAEIEIDPLAIMAIILVSVFFLGSAFWAVSIASSRRHRPWPAFVLGLLLPWIFPLVILFAMDIKGERARRRQEAKELQEREEAAARKAEAERLKAEAAMSVDKRARWTQSHFEKLARKADGTAAGPFLVNFSGQELRVEQILEAHASLVLVEFQDEQGQTQRMRIPYAKIDSWENA